MFSLAKFTSSVSIASALLSGCASVFNPVGDNKYDCNRKENPSSPYCHSFKSVEAGTRHDLPDSRFDREVKISDVDRLTGIAPPELASASSGVGKASQQFSGAAPAPVMTSGMAPTVSGIPLVWLPHQTLQPSSIEGMPVRVDPVVMRVLIKRHVNSSDSLVEDTYVYREIFPTHWAGFAPELSTNRGVSVFPHKAVARTESPYRLAAPFGSQSMQTSAPPLKDANNEVRKRDAPLEFIQPGTKGQSSGGGGNGTVELAPDPSFTGMGSMPQ